MSTFFGEVSWWTQHDLTEKFQVFFFSHPEVYPDDFNVFFFGKFQGKVKSQTLVLRSPHVERIPRWSGNDVSDCIPEKNEKQQASNISTCVFDRKDVFLSPVFSILCGLNRIHWKKFFDPQQEEQKILWGDELVSCSAYISGG